MNELRDLGKLLSAEELQSVAPMLERLQALESQEVKQKDFMTFVKHVWPGFIEGQHHKIYAQKLQEVAEGKLKRLIVCMPPRHTKSEFASFLFPAWLMGRDPTKKIIQATHTAELAVGFGRKVKGLIESEEYKEVFPGVKLAADAKASGRWSTNKRGDYYAVGTGGALAGRGADLCVHPETIVKTPNGPCLAKNVSVGDYLLGAGGFGRVRHVIKSRHTATVILNDKLRLSDFHPVLTDKGWQSACFLREGGIVYVPSSMVDVSCMDTMGTPIHDRNLSKRIQHLGYDAPKVHESQRGELCELWGSRDHGRSSMEQIYGVHRGHGALSFATAHTEQAGQRRPVLSRELCLVECGGSAKQSSQQCVCGGLWQAHDGCAMDARNRAYEGHHQSPYFCDEDGPREGLDCEAYEPQSKSCGAVDAGWTGGSSVQQLGSSWQRKTIQQSRCTSLPHGESKDLWWVPVAIRSVRRIEHEPRDFVNFHVEGSNTFVADSYLTHNCIIDDPISEQMALSPSELDKVYEWYTSGPRQRLQPGGAIIIVMTRWSIKDLVSRVLQKQAERGADKWEVVEFPAILPSGKPLWPEYWKLEELESVKATIPLAKWNAQYMQNPTSEEGAIIKREWWKRWEKDDPPACEYVIQSYDTAFSVSERSDMSAISTWGIFQPADEEIGIILLDAVSGRWEFPELKAQARELYEIYKPDMVLIEQKASGAPLTQELRRMGIPVTPFTPSRGADKMTRMNACAPMFESGLVWAPEANFADEMIEECAAFPNGDHDDLADTMTQAILRFRQGGFVVAPNDYRDDEEEMMYRRRKRVYY